MKKLLLSAILVVSAMALQAGDAATCSQPKAACCAKLQASGGGDTKAECTMSKQAKAECTMSKQAKATCPLTGKAMCKDSAQKQAVLSSPKMASK